MPQGAGNDLSDDYVEEELPRGGAGRSRARLLKKAEAHRSPCHFHPYFNFSQDFVISNPLLMATFNFEGRRREGEQMMILTIVDSLQGDLCYCDPYFTIVIITIFTIVILTIMVLTLLL